VLFYLKSLAELLYPNPNVINSSGRSSGHNYLRLLNAGLKVTALDKNLAWYLHLSELKPDR
jgi:hypothetical protein